MTQFTTLQNELAKLRVKWQAEYPGTSATVELLRESLIASEAIALHSRSAFQRFHQAAESTGLPIEFWNPKFLRQFNSLKRQQALDSRHCLRALQTLQAACAQHKAAEAKTPPPAPPPPETRPSEIVHEQIIDVRVVNGEVVTQTDRPAAFWFALGDMIWDAAYFTRRFYFQNSVVPEPYSYVLTHQGKTFPPAHHFAVSYSPDEFKRLCQLELSTGSAHLLDGKRAEYYLRREQHGVPYEEN